MRRFFLFFVLVFATLNIQAASAGETDMTDPIRNAEKLFKDGMYKDLVDRLGPWLLDEKNAKDAKNPAIAVGINLLRLSYEKLDRSAEIGEFLDKAAGIHAGNWRAMQQIAMSHAGFRQNPNQASANVWISGGSWFTPERERVRALQTMAAVMPLVEKDENKTEAAGFFLNMAEILMLKRQPGAAWRLQSLTDLAAKSEKEIDDDEGYGGPSAAPVDADGNPVLYRQPKSFEEAKNDGERWRWCLAKAVEMEPSRLAETLRKRAEFSRSQFGEQTLHEFSFFRQQKTDETDRTAGIWSLQTLPDNAVIARLADGIKRFELDEESHYIAMYRQIFEVGDGVQKAQALEELADVYLDRCQFPKAAEIYRDLIENYSTKHRRSHVDTWKNQLKSITGNWGRFETTGSKVAGVNAELRYTFRNGKKVKFTAHEIRIPTLIADIKSYLQSKPKQLNWSRTAISDIGRQLVFGNGKDEKPEAVREKYLGEKIIEWSVDLEPASKHFDRQTMISVPINKAGAYLVKAEMQCEAGAGNTEYIVLWLNDTAIVRKDLDKQQLYFVADAATGQPIADVELDFFGYQVETKYEQRPGNRQRQASVNWHFEQQEKKTDENGLIFFDPKSQERPYQWLVTAKGDRFAFLGFEHLWCRERDDENFHNVKAFFISDRPVYRPKDAVQIKAWIGTAMYGPTDENDWAGAEISYEIHDPMGEKIVEKSGVKLDVYGGMVAEFVLPKDATLGMYYVNINGLGGGTFRVEEYKKPEYEVTIDAPKEPVRLGEKVTAKISAKYYFGSPVVEATVKYKVLREKHDAEWFPWRPWDWFYGGGYGWLAYDTPWLPGWRSWGISRPAPFWFPRHSGPPEVVAEQEVKIGPEGTIEVEIDTSLAEAMFPGESQKYSITAEVVDNSRHTIVGTGTVLVSKEPFKVYAWVDRGYYEPGQKIEANFQARRLDGKPVSGDAEVKVYKIVYKESKAQETEAHKASVKFDAEGKASLSLNAAEPGQYRISCKLDGQEGGYVFNVYKKSELRPVVADGDAWKFNALELLPEKAEYVLGETVALRVNSDRADAFVLLFVKPVNGIAPKPQVVRLRGKSQTVSIPVEAKDMPNFFVEALIVSNGAVVNEMREIAVPPQKRILNVEVKPSSKTYKPGEKAKAELIVTDLAGTPASGQIVVSIYDKSVEYISGGSNVEDIREAFWKWRRHHHPGAASSFIEYSPNIPFGDAMRQLGIFGGMTAVMGGMGGGGGGLIQEMTDTEIEFTATAVDAAPMAAAPRMMMKSNAATGGGQADFSELIDNIEAVTAPALVEPTIRKNFADTALWVGALETDKDGKATIELDMPESLTTWKINVWSMGSGTRVGHGTAEVITRKDLIIRMQTPRFLVEKDQCVFSANVHNYLSNEKEVKVSLELKGPISSQNEIEKTHRTRTTGEIIKYIIPEHAFPKTVRIPAGGEMRVDWTVEAQAAGEATVTMKALTDEDSDAMQLTLPVYVHGMLKQEAWSGYVAPDKESGSVEIRVPEEHKPEQTKLTVRFSPTLAASMIDALPYLVDYPYGCTEQTLNRFLPTVLVQKILIDMNVDLEKLKTSKTNLNAQELGGSVGPERKPVIARKIEPVYDIEQVREMVADGVTKLTNMQCSDGGWGWFGGSSERSSAHLTALVVHGLRLAQKNDVAVDEDVIENGVEWLVRYEAEQTRLLKNGELSEGQRKDNRWKTEADNVDALVRMVLNENGRASNLMKDYLWRDRVRLSLYGVAQFGIAMTLEGDTEKALACVKMLEQYLAEDEENQTAWLNLRGSSNWFWWCWHGSEFETQAYYLKLLMRVDPKSPVAPRLVKYLLNNRRHATHWNSTRDTAIVIEAFAEFLKATGEDKPEMTVEVLVGGEVKKTVAITPENLFEIDNTLVLEGDAVKTGSHKVELRKKGKGPLYFNAYLENFTLEDPIKKTGLEVKVERRIYKLVRDESAQTQAAGGHGQVLDMKAEKYNRVALAPLPEGEGTLVSGDLIEIELIIESKNDYESIIIEDMKAAGLEPVDVRSGYNGNELGAYVEFQDERVVFFVYRLAKGKHTVSYRLRAEQPGSFSALPTRIEAMYAPELKGNSDENKVKIEDR